LNAVVLRTRWSAQPEASRQAVTPLDTAPGGSSQHFRIFFFRLADRAPRAGRRAPSECGPPPTGTVLRLWHAGTAQERELISERGNRELISERGNAAGT